MATGIMVSGAALGGLLVPLVALLVDLFEWRTAMLVLGLGIWAICLPLSLLVRDKPEQYGYLPDGEDSVAVVGGDGLNTSHGVGENIPAKEVLKHRAFWHISLALLCQSLVINAVLTHVMPYLSSAGIAKSISSLVAMGIPLASIAGRLGIGWLGDKFNKKIMTVLGLGTMSLGLFCFGYAPSTGIWLLVSFLILFGISYGGIVVLRPALVREYFGRTKFGTIFGLIVGINMIGTIIGPTLAGWVYDTWGSYQGIWFIFAATPAAAVIAILTISPVRKPSNKIPG